ncbi:MAG: putative RND superfamily exporter protein [Bradymonadia bacterium]|jgi:predicted RND superfamily exporter protein
MAGACLLTSVTSAVGFGSLMSAHLPIIRGFGGYTAIGIMLAFAGTMLFVPVALSKLSLPTRAPESNPVEKFGSRVTEFFVSAVTIHRGASIAVVMLTVVVALVGASRVVPDSHLMEELDAANPVAISNAVLEANHGGVLSGALVFNGERGAFSDPEALRALERVAQRAEDWRTEDGRTLVSNAFCLSDLVKEAHAEYRGDESFRAVPSTPAAVMSLLDQVGAEDRASLVSADYGVTHLTFRMYSVGSRAWSSLRAELEAAVDAEPSLSQTDWYFTGSSTLGQDAMGFMTRDLITSLGLATIIIMILMTILFRSLRLGLISMVPNLFPLLITLGVVGYLGINLRVSTAVVFSISLGIAVDDTIHVLVRFREELAKAGRTYEEALLAAMRGAGRGVVFTTIILCAGFGTLTFSEFSAVHELGVLGGVTLFAALVGDLLVLPLVLLVLGPSKRVSRSLS